MTSYQEALTSHYKSVWKSNPALEQWPAGPMNTFNPDFGVLEFPPYSGREMWTYATCGMAVGSLVPTELHIFSSVKSRPLVELLTVVSHYHVTGAALSLGHTVNFGRPWQNNSLCSYGLVSLPYLDGPELEKMRGSSTQCYWLIPITESERNFKQKFGLEKLEEQFEEREFNYLAPERASTV